MPPLFTPGTVFWRVNSDAVCMLAASRALLLELAHPMVAAGVAQHSNYRGDPFGRLLRTMRTMSNLMFADEATARQALRNFHGCHARVQGALTETTGPLPQGAHYSAHDPMLKLWVLATLYDSMLLVYDRFAAPLTLDDRRAYYVDGLGLGRLLGIPPGMMPATYEAFDDYMQAMLHSDLLAVGDVARDIVQALFSPPPVGPLANLVSWPGLGLMPPHLREAFGFSWTGQDERRLEALARWTRRLRPLVPSVIAVNPRALVAEWQWRASSAL